MSWRYYWAIHHRIYLVYRWVLSIIFALLGLFCLLVSPFAPLLFIIASLCVVCFAVANPWVAERYERWRGR